MFYQFLDPFYLLLVGPAILIALYAQFKVSSAYNKYSRIPIGRGATGRDIARAMLMANGVDNVTIEMVPGRLTDHYDPRSHTLRLSADVYSGHSVAAAGIAAHEAGHALQHAHGYAPMHLRTLLVPVASFGSNMAWILLFAGFIMSYPPLVTAGIFLFAGAVLFTIVTLPVEFNASRRAIAQLVDGRIIDAGEEKGVRAVLSAAAMTYVAAALMAVMQLLFMILRSRR